MKKKSKIIYNGQQRDTKKISKDEITNIRKNYFKINDENVIAIGLVGRINKLKGHTLLADAFSEVLKKYNNIKLIFIGSPPPNQDFYLEELQAKISELKIEKYVEIIPFQKQIWSFYDSLDICIVPSTEPESFGLVATEAMLSEKPVIVSNLGGLSEIVIDNETGCLFEPNNSRELISKIQYLIENPEKIDLFGKNGKERVEHFFNRENYVNSFKEIYDLLAK